MMELTGKMSDPRDRKGEIDATGRKLLTGNTIEDIMLLPVLKTEKESWGSHKCWDK
jgi:hypothetical protein